MKLFYIFYLISHNGASPVINMDKEFYHPNAYLVDFRNIRPGLKTRSIILNTIEKEPVNAKKIAEKTGLTYGVSLYHLRLLESQGIVRKKGKRPSVWLLTGLGQKRLH